MTQKEEEFIKELIKIYVEKSFGPLMDLEYIKFEELYVIMEGMGIIFDIKNLLDSFIFRI